MTIRDHELLTRRLLNLANGRARAPEPARREARRSGMPPSAAPAAAPSTSPQLASSRRTRLQLLEVARKWDWPVTATGVLSRQQLDLCDKMPASLDRAAPFASSADRLSDAFQAFLYLLAADFQPASLLDEARAVLRKPSDPPASSRSPEGWSKVPDGAGILRWEPTYSASAQPDEWASDIAAHGGNGGVLKFPASSEIAHSSGTEAAAGQREIVPPGAVRGVEVRAEAWGNISITPGGWYDGAMLALGRTGPFLPGWVSTSQERTGREKALFGEDGLLRGRVASLIVAYKPDFAVTVDDRAAPEIERQMAGATKIHLGGLAFEKTAEEPLVRRQRAADHTQLVGGSLAPGPYLVAVRIEEIG